MVNRRLHWFAYLLIPFAYVVSGKASLMLALPPGYASAIFLPAGIAIAAVYIAGMRTISWIFSGSLFLNLWVGYEASHQLDAVSLGAAVIIALASTVQACFGGWLLRRSIGYPAAFDNGRDVTRFLLLTPVACLVSAILSVSGLAMLGIFPPGGLIANWFTWWAGDSLGTLMMLPLAMALAGRPRSLWRGRILTVGLPMLLFLSLFIFMFLKAARWEQNESLLQFRQLSEISADRIKLGLEEQSVILFGLHGLFIHSDPDNVTRKEFQLFCNKTLNIFPTIQAMEWVPRVSRDARAGFEARQRQREVDFSIRQRGADGKLGSAGNRDEYYPVTFIEPMPGNERALGFDLASNPRRKKALDKARETGMPVCTEPINLVQGGKGVLILQTVRIGGADAGVVLAVLKLHDFVEKVLPAGRDLLELRLLDVDERVAMYDNFSDHQQEDLYQQSFSFGTRHYFLQTVPTPAYYERHRGWQSWSVLAVGTLVTDILGALLLLGTGFKARAEEHARTDLLTGLNNRRHFQTLATHELARARRYYAEISLLMLDIDHFKRFNDTYGHDAGDAVLKVFSRCSARALREFDILARWGGEEFVVLLPGVDGPEALEIAERLRVALSEVEVRIPDGRVTNFTVSVGATGVIDPDEGLEAIIKRADNALYAAKHAGRNCVRFS